MKSNSRKGLAAFTLVELMAVITIIVILAGLVVGGLGYVSEKQASSKAKVQIALLSKAIEEYKLDMGKYPGIDPDSRADGKISSQLYDKLFYEGLEFSDNPSRTDTPTDPKATKIYLADLDPRTTKQGWVATNTTAKAGEPILDPWGNQYLYRKGKSAMNPDFDLWSAGKDGKTKTTNTADDLSSVDMRDDIRNF